MTIHPSELDWYRNKATNSQLTKIIETYQRGLKIASLAEKYRQLKTDESLKELETLLDEHWESRQDMMGKPTFVKKEYLSTDLWMFTHKSSLTHNYGGLDDCLEIAKEYLQSIANETNYMYVDHALQAIRETCLTLGKSETNDFIIINESSN